MDTRNLNFNGLSGLGFDNGAPQGGARKAWEAQLNLAIKNIRECVMLVRQDRGNDPGGSVSASVKTSADAELDLAAAIITQAITDLASF